jgi:hypothetical protein
VNPYKDIDEGFESFEAERHRDEDEMRFKTRETVAMICSAAGYEPYREIISHIISVDYIMLKGERSGLECSSPLEYEGGVITFTNSDDEIVTIRWDEPLRYAIYGWTTYDERGL